MDLTRIQKLAGIQQISETTLDEVVNVSEIVDLDDAARRLIHCKNALGIANKLKDPADRKKWKSAALVNLNKVRAALNRLANEFEHDPG